MYACIYIYIYVCVCPLGYTCTKPQTRTMMNSTKESPCQNAGTWSACKEHPHKNDETLSVSKCMLQWVLHGFDWFFASWHAVWLNCTNPKRRVPMRFGIHTACTSVSKRKQYVDPCCCEPLLYHGTPWLGRLPVDWDTKGQLPSTWKLGHTPNYPKFDCFNKGLWWFTVEWGTLFSNFKVHKKYERLCGMRLGFFSKAFLRNGHLP